MDTDIVQGRKDLIAKCNDDSNHKSTRVDKTSPNSIGKIRKSHLMADKHYASRQAGYYLKLRRDCNRYYGEQEFGNVGSVGRCCFDSFAIPVHE